MKRILSHIVTPGLGVVAIYFFFASFDYHIVFAGFFFLCFLVRVFGQNSTFRFIKALKEITDYSRQCTFELHIAISIEEVLKHPAVGELFERIKTHKLVSGKTKQQWIKQLLQDYQRKSDKQDLVEEVHFNIKNNLLFRNGNIDFTDAIYHEIQIPSEMMNIPTNDWVFGEPKLLCIRVFVVNGILKLQLGRFTKSLSPEIIRRDVDGDKYKRYETIAAFPLMYFASFRIPEAYLNLSWYATNAYYIYLKGKEKDVKDWLEINKDVENYKTISRNRIGDLVYGEDSKRWEDILQNFRTKKEKMLKDNEFTEIIEDYCFWNKLMSISLKDYSETKERMRVLAGDY